MRKRILCILCAILLLFGFIPAGAASLDPTQPCSLTLSYQQGDTAFPGLEVSVCRVASAQTNGAFHLLPQFTGCAVNINRVTSQQQWRDIADTLTSHIAASQIAPTRTETTAADGKAVFSDLETGLYLVGQTVADSDEGSRVFEKFMVYLPTPVNGGYQYDVAAKPKSSPLPSRMEYSVLKLWQDAGSPHRPNSVTVDILKDGVVQESVILSTENHWFHTWSAEDDRAVWTVSERNLPEGYGSSISQRETTFLVTNTLLYEPPPYEPDTPGHPELPGDPIPPGGLEPPDVPDEPSVPVRPVPPVDPVVPDTPDVPDDPADVTPPADPNPSVPKTGDTAPLDLYIMAMSISGLVLIVLGLGSRRSKHHEKKR